MTGPHLALPLTQRQWHEQAAAIAYQPPPPPSWTPQPAPAAPNPFARNPLLVREEQ
ncbi:hypothetical protein HOU47_gp49 [Arthrobacter phage Constance]|uniref:Uncharacterized protein n=1 Tax=Arthrobacter phage Constance TaxID=2419950 RepID=A0A3G2KEU9_9CAUD|nr:hypothetical protein HOU47_gp49 [Arthrobacter phage Constance]AYN57455.1 hypothetical protein PBI_CONSTANCE_49 [Arthrobacter phage Constance]